MNALSDLVAEIRAEGGLLAAVADDPPEGAGAPLGARAAAGSRARRDPASYALVVEAVREGYLLHHGGSRILGRADPDLALLAGDRLYALGLARLAQLGDMEAVAALARVIAVSARERAAGDEAAAEAAWVACAAAVGGPA